VLNTHNQRQFSTVIAILTICIATTSCKKDETKKTTQVTINVKNGAGVAQSGLSVYMYSKTVFTTQGNDPFFAGKTATTGSDGNAVFNIVNPDDVLWTSSNTSEELYFGMRINKEKNSELAKE
jgi:hypothetical protein